MSFYSPLISNRTLSLNNNGDLQAGLDIETQEYVAITGYDCIYDSNIASALIIYFDTIGTKPVDSNTIKAIISEANVYLKKKDVIKDLNVSVPQITISDAYIIISVTDNDNNTVELNWIN